MLNIPVFFSESTLGNGGVPPLTDGTARLYVPNPAYCFSDAGGTVPCVSGDTVRVAKDYYGSGKNLTGGAGTGWKLINFNGRWRFLCGYNLKMSINSTGFSGSNALIACVARPQEATLDGLVDSNPGTGSTLRFFGGKFDWFNQTPSAPFACVSKTEVAFVGRAVLNPNRQVQLWRNGASELSVSDASTTAFSWATPVAGALNNGTVGYFVGFLGPLVIASGTYSDSTSLALSKYLSSLRDTTTPTYAANVVCDGDSLTAGFQSWAGGGYPSQMFVDKPTWKITNLGVSSQTVATMIANAPTNVDPLRATGAVVCLWGGTNDLFFGASAATTISRIKQYCTDRRNAGWGGKIVVFTLLPRSDAGTPGTFETDRQTVNTELRNGANIGVYWDVVVDVGGNATIGAPGANTNTTYYSTDLVHLIGAGQAIVKGLAEPAIAALVP